MKGVFVGTTTGVIWFCSTADREMWSKKDDSALLVVISLGYNSTQTPAS